jgi:hypothetical protein
MREGTDRAAPRGGLCTKYTLRSQYYRLGSLRPHCVASKCAQAHTSRRLRSSSAHAKPKFSLPYPFPLRRGVGALKILKGNFGFASPFHPPKNVARSQRAYVLASKLRFSPSSRRRGFIAERAVSCMSAHRAQVPRTGSLAQSARIGCSVLARVRLWHRKTGGA